MATALTLAQHREAVRRYLQIQTPLEAGVGGALAGDLPSGQPDPSNLVLNDFINQGIDAINRVVRTGLISTKNVTVAAAAATQRRKQYIDISSVVTSPLVTSEIEDIWFVETAGTNATYSLEPYKFYAGKKSYQPYQQQPPGRPMQFIVTGTQLALIPPSDRAGTLYFDVGQGIPPLVSDSDAISVLPDEYQVGVDLWAVLLCCARNGQDVESQSRMQGFAPMAMQILQQIFQWKNNFDDSGIQVVRDTLMMIPGVLHAVQATPPPGQGQQGS